MKKVKVKIISPLIGDLIPLPKYETAGSAGLDLRACLQEKITLKPGETKMIPMGFAMYLKEEDLAALVVPRSGLGSKHGIVLGNLVGLIDSDYQGPLSISLWNRSESEIVINPGERVAQLVVIRVNQVELDLVDEFIETERGNKGFGSTGVD